MDFLVPSYAPIFDQHDFCCTIHGLKSEWDRPFFHARQELANWLDPRMPQGDCRKKARSQIKKVGLLLVV